MGALSLRVGVDVAVRGSGLDLGMYYAAYTARRGYGVGMGMCDRRMPLYRRLGLKLSGCRPCVQLLRKCAGARVRLSARPDAVGLLTLNTNAHAEEETVTLDGIQGRQVITIVRLCSLAAVLTSVGTYDAFTAQGP